MKEFVDSFRHFLKQFVVSYKQKNSMLVYLFWFIFTFAYNIMALNSADNV